MATRMHWPRGGGGIAKSAAMRTLPSAFPAGTSPISSSEVAAATPSRALSLLILTCSFSFRALKSTVIISISSRGIIKTSKLTIVGSFGESYLVMHSSEVEIKQLIQVLGAVLAKQ